jgi:hypothetical protein
LFWPILFHEFEVAPDVNGCPADFLAQDGGCFLFLKHGAKGCNFPNHCPA